MKNHKILLPPQDIYPIHDWNIIQEKFSEKYLAQDETLFTVANGYLGMRGNMEEGAPYAQRGTFINAFYESWPIKYGEKAYGFAEKGQTMVNVPDTKNIKIYVDDEPLHLPVAHLKEYQRTLNMREGMLERKIVWETPTGKQVMINSKRLISMEFRHLAVMTYEVTVLNDSASIILSSKLTNVIDSSEENDMEDPRKAESLNQNMLDTEVLRDNAHRLVLGYRTKQSRMTLGCGIDHVITTENNYDQKITKYEDGGKIVYTILAEKGKPVEMIKYASYHSSRGADLTDLCDRVERTLDNSIQLGHEKIINGQKCLMKEFWDKSDIEMKGGHQRTQQVIRFNLFHIYQASVRTEGAGIGARGLTGAAYDGHYFWDSEIFVLPFLIYTEPRIARNLLKFRYSLLDKARDRARQVNQKGALFPWRTINGEESSAFFAAGTAQYHINADIMYAMKKYVDVTGDVEFLYEYGVEMLIETARLWFDLGSYPDGPDGPFHIHGVTGPDEYTAIVNNNLYTNMMARGNLKYAVDTIVLMQNQNSQRLMTVIRETKLLPDEVEGWRKAVEHMYIPYNEKKEIHPQDDNFLDRNVWDFENTPEDKYPLLLHYHPLVIYRHQVIKQADVVMAMFLLSHQFTFEEKKKNFEYYDPLTTGDSSLSACAQGIIAAEIGYSDLAAEYFHHTVLMDFGNVSGNVADGAHIAAMGGTWLSIVYGIAGMRDDDGQICFNPKLLEKMKKVKFPITIRGQIMDVEIDQKQVTYALREGKKLVFKHKDQKITLKRSLPVIIKIDS